MLDKRRILLWKPASVPSRAGMQKKRTSLMELSQSLGALVKIAKA
jgi:hypothetical protein